MAIALVQEKANVANASSTSAVSFTSGGADQLVSGNSLIVFTVSNETSTDRTHDSVSCSVDGAYTLEFEIGGGPATGRIGVWTRAGGVSSNADRTITATFSTADANTGIIVTEWSGVYVDDPVEATLASTADAANPQEATITTVTNNAAVAYLRMSDTNQQWAPTGYTSNAGTNNWWYQFVQYNLDVGTAGGETITWTSWDVDDIRAIVALTDTANGGGGGGISIPVVMHHRMLMGNG